MKIGYYHIYLSDNLNWVQLFVDQFTEFLNSGLFHKLDELNITAIGTQTDFDKFVHFLKYYYNITKVKLIVDHYIKDYSDSELNYINDSKKIIDETVTLNKIWTRCSNEVDNHQILYFHAKGITAFYKFIQKDINDLQDISIFVNYNHWRKFIEWSVLEKHEVCWELLNRCDTVGANFSKWPTPHYSGNFWWANSHYLKTLTSPIDVSWRTQYQQNNDLLNLPDRLLSEMWIGSGQSANMFSLYNHEFAPPKSSLAEMLIQRKEYYK